MVNIKTAKDVLALIEENPESFDMRDFAGVRRDKDGHVCQTTACIAGHAALISGLVEIKTETTMGGGVTGVSYHFKGGFSDWEHAGREALDIGAPLAARLFFTTERPALEALRLLADGEDEEFVLEFLESDEAARLDDEDRDAWYETYLEEEE